MRTRGQAVMTTIIKTMVAIGILAAPIAVEWRSFLQRPLGPALGYPTPPASAVQDRSAAALSIPSLVWPTPFTLPAVSLEPLCGGPPVMNILAIGSDYRYNTYLYGLSDVIKVIRVDFVTAKIMLLDFPRDLYVEIPDIAQHGGITHGKLNQPFLYGNPGLGYYAGPGEGPGLLARTLDLNYGERPDHYVAVNMQVFVKLVDAVGGVDVSLPDWELGKSPGLHHMNGSQALEFARQRPDGTFARTGRQDYVLAAFLKKLGDPSVVSSLGNLAAAFSGSVQTDLTPAQIQQLTCLAPKLSRENVQFLNWPDGMFTGTRVRDPVLGDTFIWAVDNALMRAYLSAFNIGQWPAGLISGQTGEPPATDTPPAP